MKASLQLRNGLTKLLHWEYWPLGIVYIPIIPIWLYYAIRARKLFFFTAVNPDILTGGFFGCSKMKILQKIPSNYIPPTVFIPSNSSMEEVCRLIKSHHITFPCIIKPDIGERGLKVQKIHSMDILSKVYAAINYDIIIQNFSPFDVELAILCYRIPGTESAAVTSLCRKEFLHIKGDGASTIYQLILKDPRALLHLRRFQKEARMDLTKVLPHGQEYILEPIGNHCRGTKFIDFQSELNPSLQKTFLNILDQMEDVHYGRFDLKTSSLKNASEGNDIHIFEFNGTASEPAHCYDPKNSIWYFYKTMKQHWSAMFKIYQRQESQGIRAMSIRNYINEYRKYLRLIKSYH